ncbi:MAG: glycosyltransferase family 8 protein [Erysipelotrichaceae bacterium]|nr:glycosyltransferase family 8 protein [Erysipelotrichaceae bacterium]
MENNFVYSIDDNFVNIFLVSLNSLIKYNNNSKINIMYTNLSAQNIERVKKYLDDKGINYSFFDVSEYLENISKNTLKLNDSLSTYARLFIPEILSYIDRALYLDSDTIVTAPLNELFEIDIKDNYVAGVIDPVSKQARIDVGLCEYDNYINAGVLLINIKQINKDNLVEKFIEFIRNHNGQVAYHDQGTINGVCKNKIYFLDHTFNVTSQFYVGDVFSACKRSIFRKKYKKSDIEAAQKNAKIIHYTGAFYARPWFNMCRHPRKIDFEKNMIEIGLEKEDISYSFGYKFMAFIFYNTPYWFYITFNSFVNKIRGIK